MLSRRYYILLFLILFFPAIVLAVFFSGFIKPIKADADISLHLGGSWNKSGKWYSGHLGEDFIVEPGTKVYSIADGVVEESNRWPSCDKYEIIDGVKKKVESSHSWGGVVIVKHDLGEMGTFNTSGTILENSNSTSNPSNVFSQYGHLTNIQVAVGQKVQKGQYLGDVADMCMWTAHFHFEIKDSYAISNEILGGVGSGYSGTDGYAPNRYAPSKFIELNKNLVVGKQEVTSVAVSTPSLLTRIKNFFTNLFFSNNTNPIATDVAQAQTEEPIYNLEMLNSPQTVNATTGETERLVVVNVKNTGNTTWKKSEVSLNVSGGREANQIYRHPSWLTDLRPTLLDQNSVPPDGTGTFSFFISLPVIPGSYTFQAQVVRQEGTRFSQIGNRFFILNLNITKLSEPKKEVLGEKIEAVIEEVVNEAVNVISDLGSVIKEIPVIIFGGGGGGATDSANAVATNNTNTIEMDNTNDIATNTTNTTTEDNTTDTDDTDSTDSTTTTIDNTENEEVVESVASPEIVISSPSVSSTITNIVSSTIAGTKNEATEKIYLNNSADLIMFNSSTAWEANVSLAEGQNVFEIYGENSVGEKTVTSTVEIILDSIPPSVPIVTRALDTSSATPTIYLTWSSTDDGMGLANYNVDYQVDTGEWQSLFLETTSTDYLMQVNLLQTYNFRARARDNLDNTSVWSTDDGGLLADWPKTVIINEVDWMGTSYIKNSGSDCTKQEWLELYNNTGEIIDLTGWVLEVIDSAGKIDPIALSGAIPNNDYYLMAREYKTNKVALLNLDLDLIYQKNELPDAGARLLLKDNQGNIIDEANFLNGWPAGTKTAGSTDNQYQPMGRIDSKLPGSTVSNWKTMSFITPFGKTNNCGKLFGAPSRVNTGMWLLDAPEVNYSDYFVDNKMTLTKDNNPYVFKLTTKLPVGYTLQIDPGVILIGESKDSLLEISGNLIVNGSTEDPVIFTSARDANYGIWNLPNFDTNPPAPGDWSRIEIKNNGSATINNAKFFYGGNYFKQSDGFFSVKRPAQVFRITGGSLEINNTYITNSYNAQAVGNIGTPWQQYNSSVWADNSDKATTTLKITNSIFDTGWMALKFTQANNGYQVIPEIRNNVFKNYSSDKATVDLGNIPAIWEDNVFENNTVNDVVGLVGAM